VGDVRENREGIRIKEELKYYHCSAGVDSPHPTYEAFILVISGGELQNK
jgi:hypothetical protein